MNKVLANKKKYGAYRSKNLPWRLQDKVLPYEHGDTRVRYFFFLHY
jgi:hypothetical protein